MASATISARLWLTFIDIIHTTFSTKSNLAFALESIDLIHANTIICARTYFREKKTRIIFEFNCLKNGKIMNFFWFEIKIMYLLEAHSSIFISQWMPVNPGIHLHVYRLMPSIHVAPFRHGSKETNHPINKIIHRFIKKKILVLKI